MYWRGAFAEPLKWKKKFLKPMRHTGRIRVEEEVLQQELARANELRETFLENGRAILYGSVRKRSYGIRDDKGIV